jgi:ribose/xylose/arabinose/galactoside ABC-type transport system permease subunit
VVGTAIGSLILALVVNGMNMLSIATFWQAFAMGVILILAVLADVSFKRRMS